jgi:hypothetical protein
VIRNYQLEDLLKQLLEAKKNESEKYFDQVANQGVGGGQEGVLKDKSPIETVSVFNLHILVLYLY